MVKKEYWKKSIDEYTEMVNKENKIRKIIIKGIPFDVFPGVFSPIYSSDTVWFAEKIPLLTVGKKFLEIGAGTGIIACLCAMNGASLVVATDINPKAIINIESNVKAHSLEISVRQGNVFSPITKNEQFDVIFWNHPFYYTEKSLNPEDTVGLSVSDLKYKALHAFFREGKKHLATNGQLILGTSNIARINLIKQIAKSYGYRYMLLDKAIVSIYQGKKVQMDIRIYSFVAR